MVVGYVCSKVGLGCVANPKANRTGGECEERSCNFAVLRDSAVAVESRHVRNQINKKGWKTWISLG